MNSRWITLLELGLVALLLTVAANASVVGTFDRTLTVTGPVDLEVLTHSGDITVRSGPAGTVAIHAIIQVGSKWLSGSHDREVHELQQNPPIHQNGNSIRIEYADVRDISVDYQITVPTETTLRSHTGSGDQTVNGLKGHIELESGSGDLRLAFGDGPATLSGKVALADLDVAPPAGEDYALAWKRLEIALREARLPNVPPPAGAPASSEPMKVDLERVADVQIRGRPQHTRQRRRRSRVGAVECP